MTPQLRAAIRTVAEQRQLSLSDEDVEALVAAVVPASAWVDDEEAMRLAGRSNVDSLRAYCSRHSVTRVHMTNRGELERAIREMPGRGRFPRRRGAVVEGDGAR